MKITKYYEKCYASEKKAIELLLCGGNASPWHPPSTFMCLFRVIQLPVTFAVEIVMKWPVDSQH